MIDTASVFICCLLLIYVAYRAAKLDALERAGGDPTNVTRGQKKRFTLAREDAVGDDGKADDL